MANLLIIDEDRTLYATLRRELADMGHRITPARTLHEGLGQLEASSIEIVLLEVFLPDGNGLKAMGRIRQCAGRPDMIVITHMERGEGLEPAFQNGAWDYMTKPVDPRRLKLQIERILQHRLEKSTHPSTTMVNRTRLIGESLPMQQCFRMLEQAAGCDANVLVTGETGTGKEVFCRVMHENSVRADQNFVVVDCAALPDTLVESVLFGHVKGAFTGAERNQAGLVKQADGGTLFLDEIGELPLAVQKSFLRVLQERRYRPVGSHQEQTSDFRLVAATNRNLHEMVREGQFREDLLYRLQALSVELPPLRHRPEDIESIVFHYLHKLCEQHHIATKRVDPELIETLQHYDWPGNVRELINALETAIAAAGAGTTLFSAHLPVRIRLVSHQATQPSLPPDPINGPRRGFRAPERSRMPLPQASSALAPAPAPAPIDPDWDPSLPTFREYRQQVIDHAERQYLEHLIPHSAQDIREACRISGLSKSRLYELMQKHRLSARQ